MRRQHFRARDHCARRSFIATENSPHFPPDRAVESLQTRLAQAQQDATRRQQLEERIERERKAVSKAKREIETARLALEALLAQARCATREALLAAETRSQHSRQLAAEIEIENRALAGHAGSQPIDLFAAEVAPLDRESLRAPDRSCSTPALREPISRSRKNSGNSAKPKPR